MSDAGASESRRHEVAGSGSGALGTTQSEQSDTLHPGAERTLPGWALRLMLAAVSAIAIGVAMAGAPEIGVLSVAGVVMMLLVIGTAAAPASVVPLLLLIGLVIYRVIAVGPALDAGLAALVLLMPLIHQLAGVAGAVPARSRCRWQVLRPPTIRFAIAVLPVEVALLAAALIV